MEPVLLILVCAVAALGWWWWKKRRPEPVEDERILPPASETPTPHLMARKAAAPADPAGPPAASPPAAPSASGRGVILDREFLLKRDRTFDPRNWDNSPDPVGFVPGEAEVEGDLPTFFDREYLEKRARERGQGDPA